MEITINGWDCEIQDSPALTDTQAVCQTSNGSSIETQVQVKIKSSASAENGNAMEATDGASDFEYVDLWSSIYTWGESGRKPGEV